MRSVHVFGLIGRTEVRSFESMKALTSFYLLLKGQIIMGSSSVFFLPPCSLTTD